MPGSGKKPHETSSSKNLDGWAFNGGSAIDLSDVQERRASREACSVAALTMARGDTQTHRPPAGWCTGSSPGRTWKEDGGSLPVHLKTFRENVRSAGKRLR